MIGTSRAEDRAPYLEEVVCHVPGHPEVQPHANLHEAARRAESGIGALMKEAPGFRGYYIFDAGNRVAGSVTLFETREAAEAANQKALGWIQGSQAI